MQLHDFSRMVMLLMAYDRLMDGVSVMPFSIWLNVVAMALIWHYFQSMAPLTYYLCQVFYFDFVHSPDIAVQMKTNAKLDLKQVIKMGNAKWCTHTKKNASNDLWTRTFKEILTLKFESAQKAQTMQIWCLKNANPKLAHIFLTKKWINSIDLHLFQRNKFIFRGKMIWNKNIHEKSTLTCVNWSIFYTLNAIIQIC